MTENIKGNVAKMVLMTVNLYIISLQIFKVEDTGNRIISKFNWTYLIAYIVLLFVTIRITGCTNSNYELEYVFDIIAVTMFQMTARISYCLEVAIIGSSNTVVKIIWTAILFLIVFSVEEIFICFIVKVIGTMNYRKKGA